MVHHPQVHHYHMSAMLLTTCAPATLLQYRETCAICARCPGGTWLQLLLSSVVWHLDQRIGVIHRATAALHGTPAYREMVMRNTDAMCYFLCECIARELALCWYAVVRFDGAAKSSLQAVTKRVHQSIQTWRTTVVPDRIRSSVVAMLGHILLMVEEQHGKRKADGGGPCCLALLCGMLWTPPRLPPAEPSWQQSLHNHNHRVLLGLIWHLFKAPDLAPYLAGLARRHPH